LPAVKDLKDHVRDDVSGREVVLRRLVSTGIFNDPNELA